MCTDRRRNPWRAWAAALWWHWGERRRYRGTRDWLLSVYHRLLTRWPRWPLPGRRAVVGVRPAGGDGPYSLRLGTSDWEVMRQILFRGEYAPVLRRNLRDVRTVVDLGANIGVSLRLWRCAYPGARIVAVEPDAENVLMCRRNAAAAAAGPGRVAIVQACVAGRARQVSLDRSGGEWGYKMRDGGSDPHGPVGALTLPQILEQCGCEGALDVLKCDIEGAEAELFADCAAWIDRVAHLVVELHPPYSAERFLQDLRRGGGHLQVYHAVEENGFALLFLERSATGPPDDRGQDA